jgi:gas vesicle protein
MGTNAEELTTTPADIEATRADLTRDIDELTDKVSPQRIVERRKDAARSRVSSFRDKMLGTASDVGSKVSSSGGSGGGALDSVKGSTRSAADSLESTTEGHPLTAGLVAFGAGMLISALLPPSSKETELADNLVSAAKEHAQPLVEEAKSVGQDIGQNLADSANESVQQVKDTAQEGVQNVKEEGQSSAKQVKDDATPS